MNISDLAGCLGCILLTVSNIPQIAKIRKTRCVKSISTGMYWLVLSGLSLLLFQQLQLPTPDKWSCLNYSSGILMNIWLLYLIYYQNNEHA
jgi:uncharacterized protein with PQ loop repeat